jgi:hypothetical protein
VFITVPLHGLLDKLPDRGGRFNDTEIEEYTVDEEDVADRENT